MLHHYTEYVEVSAQTTYCSRFVDSFHLALLHRFFTVSAGLVLSCVG